MPTYSYECCSCAHVFDVFHAMSADPKIKCEKCNKKCRRLIGTGAGIIFKGSGFYETDYKDKKGKAPDAPKSEKKEGEGKPKKEGASKPKKEGGSPPKAANS